ncbi:hypothetical protein OG604_49075 [Streptomyces sp. NBC_01231]|nr:hypothetical protein OG604_49075 [Streptomyces sp. NBC_01231]
MREIVTFDAYGTLIDFQYGRKGSADCQPYDELPDLSGCRSSSAADRRHTGDTGQRNTEPSAANPPSAIDGREVLP